MKQLGVEMQRHAVKQSGGLSPSWSVDTQDSVCNMITVTHGDPALFVSSLSLHNNSQTAVCLTC